MLAGVLAAVLALLLFDSGSGAAEVRSAWSSAVPTASSVPQELNGTLPPSATYPADWLATEATPASSQPVPISEDPTPLPAAATPLATPQPSSHPTPTAIPSPAATTTPTPLPTSVPTPQAAPTLAQVPAGHFGPKTTVVFFDVVGATSAEITASINAQSHLAFTGASAFAWVDPTLNSAISYATTTHNGASTCEVVLNGPLAVSSTYQVYIPRWSAPQGAPANLVQWWNDSITKTLPHERHHIDIYESMLTQLNTHILPGADCAAAGALLAESQAAADIANCQFDLDEYGAAAGSSLADCLAHQAAG